MMAWWPVQPGGPNGRARGRLAGSGASHQECSSTDERQAVGHPTVEIPSSENKGTKSTPLTIVRHFADRFRAFSAALDGERMSAGVWSFAWIVTHRQPAAPDRLPLQFGEKGIFRRSTTRTRTFDPGSRTRVLGHVLDPQVL